MRRLFRDIIPLLSTLLGATGVLLSIHSFCKRDDCWEFSTLRAHYTVLSRNGYLQIMAPPSAGGADQATAWNALKYLRNDQFRFTASIEPGVEGGWGFVQATAVPGSAAADLNGLPFSSACVVLLRGLDSPQKFAAANLLLHQTRLPIGAPGREVVAGFDPRKPADKEVCGFEFHVPVVSVPFPTQSWEITSVPVNPFELAQLRRSWHQALDVQLARFNYAWVILPTLILPILRLHSLRQSRLQRRRGCCAKCGYDLRFSLDRCPECGASTGATR
jgi:hypothetical protein